jgi:large subunit ribosomal protein L25
VSHLDIGGQIRIGEIALPSGVVAMLDAETLVAQVVAPRVAEEEAPAEGEEGAEGEAAEGAEAAAEGDGASTDAGDGEGGGE